MKKKLNDPIIIGDKVGEGCYPIYYETKTHKWPIGFAIKQKKGWLGVRQSHAFERPTRAAVIESLKMAHLANGS